MSEVTNTLVIYKLPKHMLEIVTKNLNGTSPPGLLKWIQLRFMRRILAVFETHQSAADALPRFRNLLANIEGCKDAHIGFSISDVEASVDAKIAGSHLQLPDAGKLWFVSPPPSPPNEWEETMEEEPNRRTHYEDEFNNQLMKALRTAQESKASGSLETPISPRDPDKHFQHATTHESPRTVTIIEANKSTPALQVTADGIKETDK